MSYAITEIKGTDPVSMKRFNQIVSEANTALQEIEGKIPDKKSENYIWVLQHAKSGNFHNLTGLSGVKGTLCCQFKATADYINGEQFTLDGSLYNIKMLHGEAQGSGLFQNGTLVIVAIDTEKKTLTFNSARGVNIVSSASLPSGQITGDIWIEEI